MDEQHRLIATYGACRICHAPRNGVLYVDDDTTFSSRLVCTADPEHGPDAPPPGARPATAEDRARLQDRLRTIR